MAGIYWLSDIKYLSAMSRKSITIAAAIVAVAAFSCTHDPVIPKTPEISFKDQVQPIYVNNCARSGCHDGNEFSLQTYDEIRSNVSPGDARGSKTYRAMTRLWGESAMPPDGPLSDQQINLVYAWIMQGAKDN